MCEELRAQVAKCISSNATFELVFYCTLLFKMYRKLAVCPVQM